MKRIILSSIILLWGSVGIAQDGGSEAKLKVYLDRNLVTNGLTADEQMVQRALGAIDSGKVNSPSKLFIVEGNTVWALDVEPGKSIKSILPKTVDIEIDGGLTIESKTSKRFGRTTANFKKIKIGPGAVGFVVVGGVALCAYFDGCNDSDDTEGIQGDIEISPVEIAPATE